MLENKINYPDYFNSLTRAATVPEMVEEIRSMGYSILPHRLYRQIAKYRRLGYCAKAGRRGRRNVYMVVRKIPAHQYPIGNAFDWLKFFDKYLQTPKTIKDMMDDMALEGHFPCRGSVNKTIRGYYAKGIIDRRKAQREDNYTMYEYWRKRE